MRENKYITAINFYLGELASPLRFQIEIEENRIVDIYPDTTISGKGIHIITECNPKQAALPYPDKFQIPDLLDVHLTQALAIESFFNTTVPAYARFVRILLLELSRLQNHFGFFHTLGNNIQFPNLIHHAKKDQKIIKYLFSKISQVQKIDKFIVIGGISHDIPVGFIEIMTNSLQHMNDRIHYYRRILTRLGVFTDLLTNIGIIPHSDAEYYQLTGPNFRASQDNFNINIQNGTLFKDIDIQPIS